MRTGPVRVASERRGAAGFALTSTRGGGGRFAQGGPFPLRVSPPIFFVFCQAKTERLTSGQAGRRWAWGWRAKVVLSGLWFGPVGFSWGGSRVQPQALMDASHDRGRASGTQVPL